MVLLQLTIHELYKAGWFHMRMNTLEQLPITQGFRTDFYLGKNARPALALP